MHLTLRRSSRCERGFSLVEMMVAMTISMMLLAALSGVFVASMGSRSDLERANQQIENGRYALQAITDDLQLAGYLGDFDIGMAMPSLTLPADLPDPCTVTLANLQAALPFHVQGTDNAALTCITGAPLNDSVRAGTDIIVVRRLSNCVGGSAGCPMVANSPYFQASRCTADEDNPELSSLDPTQWFRMNTDVTATGPLNRRDRTCVAGDYPLPVPAAKRADLRRVRLHIYYIANNDQAGDGIPTLKRAELRGASLVAVPLAHGIENLQVEYGLDTDGDGQPDAYTANPSTFNSCATAACRMTNWRNVMGSKVYLIARTNTPVQEHNDTRIYTLGRTAAGTANTSGPFNDAFKRRVFQGVVRFNNPAERR